MDPGSPFAMVCVPPGCVMAAMSHSVSNKVLYQKKKKKKKKKKRNSAIRAVGQ